MTNLTKRNIHIQVVDTPTETLVQELESRGVYIEPFNEVTTEDMEALFLAFKFNNETKALELARKIAADYKGAIL